MKPIQPPRFSVVLLVLFCLFLAGCTPNPNPAQFKQATLTPTVMSTETVTRTPTLTLVPISTGTPTPLLPTTSSLPSLTPVVADRILDWKPIPVLSNGISMLAFDGDWLIAESPVEIVDYTPKYSLFAYPLKDAPNGSYQEIFNLPEGKMASRYESGNGLQVAGGRVAVVSAPSGGDSALGYELYLIDLESKTTKLLKESETAYPAIALSDRWLVLLDSSSEQAGGEWCMESYHLPDGPFQKMICSVGRIQWPALDNDILAYKFIEPGQECSILKRINLVTGEETTYQPGSCQIGIRVFTSETLTTWYELTGTGYVTIGGADTQTGPFSLDVLQWGSSQRICGRSVYRLIANQGAIELRSYHPGDFEETLLRYRPKNLDPSYELPDGKFSQDANLPEYSYFDFDCSNSWLAINTSDGFFVAQDERQTGP
jgi:hypothetical protein